jgi:hypothetical protein
MEYCTKTIPIPIWELCILTGARAFSTKFLPNKRSTEMPVPGARGGRAGFTIFNYFGSYMQNAK